MKSIFPFLFVLLSIQCFAQKNELGVHFGTLNYQGELSDGINYSHLSPTYGLFLRQNWNDAVSTRYTLAFGKISDDDKDADQKYQQVRDHAFQTSILELAAQLEYNFYSFRKPRVRTRGVKATPYVFVGIAGYRMTNQLQDDYNSDSKTHQYQLAIPIGVGLKVKVSEYLNVGLDVAPRLTFTDDLDNLSLEKGKNKFHEGNKHDNDWYFTSHLTFSYVFPSSLCPKFR